MTKVRKNKYPSKVTVLSPIDKVRQMTSFRNLVYYVNQINLEFDFGAYVHINGATYTVPIAIDFGYMNVSKFWDIDEIIWRELKQKVRDLTKDLGFKDSDISVCIDEIHGVVYSLIMRKE